MYHGTQKGKSLKKLRCHPRLKDILLASILCCSIYCVSNVHGQALNEHNLQSKLTRKDVVNNLEGTSESDSSCGL